MGHWLTVESAEQALTMALANQDPYASSCATGSRQPVCPHEYQLLLTTHGITTNMSKRGNYLGFYNRKGWRLTLGCYSPADHKERRANKELPEAVQELSSVVLV